jgi:hypothetical protein
MPGELLTLPSASRTDFQVVRLHLNGQFHTPDHGPPKILILATPDPFRGRPDQPM